MAETPPTRRHYNRDIECLRAVAVLGVVFHHMQGNLFRPGLPALGHLFHYADFWFGVDLFLAVSGFVIARSLLPQIHACGKQRRRKMRVIIAFWIRRVTRLLPSAWFWLAVMLLAAIFFNSSGAFESVHANVMATLAGVFDVANFRFADAFFRYPYGSSFVYWSLSLEEQFYLLLPLAVLLLRRRIDVLMIVLIVVQFFVLRTPLLMMVRTDAIAWGVLLAIMFGSRAYMRVDPSWLLRLRALRTALPLILLGCLAVLASTITQNWRFRIGMIALVSAALVWLASYDRDYLLREGWLKRILVWVGARSYAIYLIQIPVYFALRESGYRLGVGKESSLSLSPWLLALIALVLILGLAHLNYRYLEQPLRRRGRAFAKRYLARGEASRAAVNTGSLDNGGSTAYPLQDQV